MGCLTLPTLIYLFGAYALVDGIFAVGMSIRHVSQRQTHGWMTLLEGLASIIVGLVAFSLPRWTALALVVFRVQASLRGRTLVRQG